MLTACRSAYDCGPRQLCQTGFCQCPLNYGLTGMPDCQTWSTGSYYSMMLLIVTSVAQLCLAALHGLALYHHLSGNDAGRTASDCVSLDAPSENGPAPLSGRLRRTKQFLQRLTTRKSLFCLFSIGWLLLMLVNRVDMMVLMITDVPVGPLLAYPTSVAELVMSSGFVLFSWSYLVAGRIWLDVASQLGRPSMRRFNKSVKCQLIFLLSALLIFVMPVKYLSTPNEKMRTLTKLSSVGTMGFVCSACFALSATVIVRALHMRAQQITAVEATPDQPVTITVAPTPVVPPPQPTAASRHQEPDCPPPRPSGGAGPDVKAARNSPLRQLRTQSPGRPGQDQRERKRVRKLLEEARRLAFKPSLEHVSEAENSAVEQSAAQSAVSLSSGGSRYSEDDLDDDAEDGMGDWETERKAQPKTQQRQADEAVLPVAPAPAASDAVPNNAQGSSIAAAVAADYNKLSWLIASMALKVGLSFVVTLSWVAVDAALGARGLKDDPTIAIITFYARFIAYPLIHLWANLTCLQVISKDVRLVAGHVWTLILGPVIFIWYVVRLCCNEPVMDITEDDILMTSIEGGEQAAH